MPAHALPAMPSMKDSLPYQWYIAHPVRPDNVPAFEREGNVVWLPKGEVFCRMAVTDSKGNTTMCAQNKNWSDDKNNFRRHVLDYHKGGSGNDPLVGPCKSKGGPSHDDIREAHEFWHDMREHLQDPDSHEAPKAPRYVVKPPTAEQKEIIWYTPPQIQGEKKTSKQIPNIGAMKAACQVIIVCSACPKAGRSECPAIRATDCAVWQRYKQSKRENYSRVYWDKFAASAMPEKKAKAKATPKRKAVGENKTAKRQKLKAVDDSPESTPLANDAGSSRGDTQDDDDATIEPTAKGQELKAADDSPEITPASKMVHDFRIHGEEEMRNDQVNTLVQELVVDTIDAIERPSDEIE